MGKCCTKFREREETDYGGLEAMEVSLKQLQQIAADQPSVGRVGATNSWNRRRGEYAREGYRGTMYFARSSHMKQDENDLLDLRDYKYNIQKKSNMKNINNCGFIYAISGERQ